MTRPCWDGKLSMQRSTLWTIHFNKLKLLMEIQLGAKGGKFVFHLVADDWKVTSVWVKCPLLMPENHVLLCQQLANWEW